MSMNEKDDQKGDISASFLFFFVGNFYTYNARTFIMVQKRFYPMEINRIRSRVVKTVM